MFVFVGGTFLTCIFIHLPQCYAVHPCFCLFIMEKTLRCDLNTILHCHRTLCIGILWCLRVCVTLNSSFIALEIELLYQVNICRESSSRSKNFCCKFQLCTPMWWYFWGWYLASSVVQICAGVCSWLSTITLYRYRIVMAGHWIVKIISRT